MVTSGSRLHGLQSRRSSLPCAIGKEIDVALETWELMKGVRGHRMAKAAIENACWDLEAKRLNRPLWKHLGGTRAEISCGVSIGIQNTPEALIEKIETELAAGYQRIKIRDKAGMGLENHRSSARQVPREIRLMADAELPPTRSPTQLSSRNLINTAL